VYQPIQGSLEEMCTLHAKMAEIIGQPQVDKPAHLYGMTKMHKLHVGVRWIAGASMSYVGRDKRLPTTSIGQSAAGLGGMLRAVIHTLRAEDLIDYRQT